ncbi:MAG TPA: hypothetical protein VNF28_05005 [Candidatus Binataceae bacterium]|nr:hypothetical protein [Candidatus Binataceae bacterium]
MEELVVASPVEAGGAATGGAAEDVPGEAPEAARIGALAAPADGAVAALGAASAPMPLSANSLSLEERCGSSRRCGLAALKATIGARSRRILLWCACMPATTATTSIAATAAVVPAMRQAGLISNQRPRMPVESEAALRAAAAPNPAAAEAVSTVGAARSRAASVPWHRAHPEKWVSRRARSTRFGAYS